MREIDIVFGNERVQRHEKYDEAYTQLEEYAKKQTEVEVLPEHWISPSTWMIL